MINKNANRIAALAGFILLGIATNSNAIDYSYTGNFVNDNDVQFFTFSVGAASSDVILRTWSYAGGVNAAGQTIARGGFDPILAVFDSSGNLINQNDDGGAGHVGADSVTGRYWDTFLDLGFLGVGSYQVAVMQYNNFANGPTLANGFVHDGVADLAFTHTLVGQPSGLFWDVSGNQRDSHWAFDILGVEQATQVNNMPDAGSTSALLGLVFGGFALLRKRLQD